MKKTATVTANISPALKLRLMKEARRQGKTMSAFLDDELSFAFYGRGRKAADYAPTPSEPPKPSEHFLDQPMPAHIAEFNKDNQNIH